MKIEIVDKPGFNYVYFRLIDDNNDIVSLLVATTKYTEIPRPLCSLFDNSCAYIGILKSYERRHGYASQLLKRAIEYYNGKKIYLIASSLSHQIISDKDLIHFYEHNGFKCVKGDLTWGTIMLHQ